MKTNPDHRAGQSDQRYLGALAVALALAVFAITWVSIRQSRSDSFELLAEQGRAFTESLARAAENAVSSETFYDYLARSRYSDLVVTLMDLQPETLDEQGWASFAFSHDLVGVYLYDQAGELSEGVTARGGDLGPPEFVEIEVDSLVANPESRFVLLLDESSEPGEMHHYYLELTARMDQVVVLVTDALAYRLAIEETGIAHLVEAMGREPGVEYIVYHTLEGVAFTSNPEDSYQPLESDPFLYDALEADGIVERTYDYAGHPVLELVRPFSTELHPFGLLRVGLSLEKYYDVSRGFDQQLIILSGVLLVLLMIALAYLRGRRKRWEMAERFELERRRKERLTEMGDLAAGVAHEIRNPLNTISIAAQRLAREFEPKAEPEKFAGFTGQIRTETKRLNEIITRFLALAREEKKAHIEVELDRLLDEIGALLKVEGDRIGLVVRVEAEPGLRIKADPDRIKELFLNLFNNSKEALDGEPGKFEVAAKGEGDKIVITVTDDGPGIQPDLHERVFAPYYTTKEAGTGLGLPTVQRIVTDLGGEVRLDSQQGTSFVISLPSG